MTDLKYTFEVVNAESFMDELIRFYQRCDRTTQIKTDDTFVVARDKIDISAVVRLCFEESEYILRTMQVRPDLQGQGLGRELLQKFSELLAKRKIDRVFCMPYAHLECFYGLIGFKKIDIPMAPEFLRSRAQAFHDTHPDKKIILMVR